jgi:hypothetical protein
LATALLATIGVAPAYAISFAEQTGGNNPFNSVDVGSYSVPTFVDIDNDGDFDAFIGTYDEGIHYYKNTGSNSSPTFTAQIGENNPFNDLDVGNYSSAPTFVDIDNDGDIDAFIGSYTDDDTFFYYKNTGNNSSPTFTAQTGGNNPFNGVDVGYYSKPFFVDIDNDGDFDAFIGEDEMLADLICFGSCADDVHYYKNTGNNSSPTFTAQTGGNDPFNGVDVGDYVSPTFVDIDNDGDFDAFIGKSDGTINYYKNTGNNSSPTFTAQTEGNNPFNGVDLGDEGYSAGLVTPTFVDIDNDGDFDAFIGESDGSINYYKNTTAVADTTAPTFVSGYPSVSGTSSSGFTLTVQLNEAGTAYYVVVTDGATAPTATEVKAGTAASGATAADNGSISVSAASTSATAAVSGLSAGTAYDVYVVGQDNESTPNVMSSASKADVTTTVTNTAPTAATLVSPDNGSTVTSPVTLSWNASTDADNNTLSYTVSVCSDSSFSGCTADNVSLAFAPQSFPGDPGSSELILPWSNSAYAISSAASSSSGNSTGMQPKSWVLAFFLLIGVSGFSAMLSRGRRKLVWACAMLTFWLVSCAAVDDNKSATTDNESATTDNESVTTSAVGSITHTVNNLVSGTTYYWKVTTSDGTTTTDSAVRNFTVE